MPQGNDYPGQQKKNFQKARCVRSIVGYTEVAEPEYALSFFHIGSSFWDMPKSFFSH